MEGALALVGSRDELRDADGFDSFSEAERCNEMDDAALLERSGDDWMVVADGRVWSSARTTGRIEDDDVRERLLESSRDGRMVADDVSFSEATGGRSEAEEERESWP